MIKGCFLRTVSYLPHVKEPVMKGHLSCRDTFSGILKCPLKTGFTVYSFGAIVFKVTLYCFMYLGLRWMKRIEKENVAHMLSTMHLVIRQQDGHEQGCGQYKHLTNLTYEKFVERSVYNIIYGDRIFCI